MSLRSKMFQSKSSSPKWAKANEYVDVRGGSGRKSLEAQFLWKVSTPVSYLGLLPLPLWILWYKLSNNSNSMFFLRPLAKRWWFREPIRFLLQARLARMLCVTVIWYSPSAVQNWWWWWWCCDTRTIINIDCETFCTQCSLALSQFRGWLTIDVAKIVDFLVVCKVIELTAD